MEYDVKHNDRTVGALQVETEGLMTAFEARTSRLEGVQRLWVHGAEKIAYLGVLMPAGNEMCLRKKLSRRDMADFPEKILFASTAGETLTPYQPQQQEKHPEPSEPETAVDLPRERSGLDWHASTMGTMVALCEGIAYTAIPAMLRRGVRGVRIETIGGADYIIFRRSY